METGKRGRVDRWLLERLAPEDADAALGDLAEERRDVRKRHGALMGMLHYWAQLLAICAWAILGRRGSGSLRPVFALRLALRGLARSPGITVTAILTLAVGLAPAVILLGVLYGSFRTLPVPDGEEIMQVQLLDARAQVTGHPAGVLEALRGAPGVKDVGAVRPFQALVVHPEAPAVRAYGAAMSPSVLALLQLPPARGRIPTDDPSDADAVVLGWDVWQEELGGREDVLGQTLRLDGEIRTVIAVMPPEFGFPENQSIWTVLPADGNLEGTELVARIDRATDPGQVVLGLERALVSLPVAGTADGPYRARVQSWVAGRGEQGEDVAFGGLTVLVTLLLVICAANVSTLLLVRAAGRADTLAVHSALGAPRRQVAFQLFSEALLIALVGGLVGLAAGHGGLLWLEARLSPHWGYYWMRMEVVPGVIGGTFVAVLGAAVLAGTLPALRAARPNLRGVLSGQGRSPSAESRRLGHWFVGLQVTLSSIGLVAALYLGLGALRSVEVTDLLPLDRVTVASLTLPSALPGDEGQRERTFAAVREELTRIPGVTAVSISVGIPGFTITSAPLILPDQDGPAGGSPRVFWLGADPALFDTYESRILSGRGIRPSDEAGSAPVVVVTAAFARRWFGEGRGVGERLRLDGVHEASAWAEIVGVVEDHSPDQDGLHADQVFVPLAQLEAPGTVWLSVATDGPAAADIRSAVRRADPGVAVDQPRTLRDLITWLWRMPRVMAAFGAFGGLAGVLVAAIGLYGVVTFQVRRRFPEIGVRMALGAPSDRILRDILRGVIILILPGTAIGLALAFFGSPVLRIFIAGDPRSPWLYLTAAATMAAVALVATLRPALRASRLEPHHVLRTE